MIESQGNEDVIAVGEALAMNSINETARQIREECGTEKVDETWEKEEEKGRIAEEEEDEEIEMVEESERENF